MQAKHNTGIPLSNTPGVMTSESDSQSSVSTTANYNSLANAVSTTGSNTTASSAAAWWDLVTITGRSGSAGTTGTAFVQTAASGNVTVGSGGSADFNYQLITASQTDFLSSDGNYTIHNWADLIYSNATAGTQSIDQLDNGSFTFTYGTQFVMEMVDGASASGAASVDPSLNITSVGVSNIVLPVGATLSSLSGTVYHVSAVPLPAGRLAVWFWPNGTAGCRTSQDGPRIGTINSEVAADRPGAKRRAASHNKFQPCPQMTAGDAGLKDTVKPGY